MGRRNSGGVSCFNDDAVIGLRNLVTERAVTERVPNARVYDLRANDIWNSNPPSGRLTAVILPPW